MAFNIRFDYRFATSDFFTTEVRAALDHAAGVWEGLILDEFPDVPAGIDFTVPDPANNGSRTTVTLDEPIDDLLIFVGAQTPPFGIGDEDTSVLARAQLAGRDAEGDVFGARISSNFRGSGPVTDFEPFAGSISFHPTQDWSFNTEGPPRRPLDFSSVAMHEIGHILGIGISEIFQELATEEGFAGPNALDVNGGEPIPLHADGGHIEDGLRDGTLLMDPTVTFGTRKLPESVDLAMLADIGYEIEGFTKQGTTPRIVTEGDDIPIMGTVGADNLNAGGGDDQVLANDGDDVIDGGPGVDSLSGQAGDDRLRGGQGDDLMQGGAGDDDLLGQDGRDLLKGGDGADSLSGGVDDDVLAGQGGRDTLNGGPGSDTFYLGTESGNDVIEDFEPGLDLLLVDPALGLKTAAEILDTATRLSTGASRLDLAGDTSVEIEGGRLTPSDVAVGRLLFDGAVDRAPIAEADRVSLGNEASVTIDVLENDRFVDPGEATVTLISAPLRGEARMNSDNTVTFAPDAGFAGSTSFTYRVLDETGAGDTATVTIHRPLEDGPDLELLAMTLPAQLSAVYVGYFGRAPDAAGLDYWVAEYQSALAQGAGARDVLNGIAESFRLSEESRNLFPLLDPAAAKTANTAEIEAFVGDVFGNLFDRSPSATGQDFWVDEIGGRLDAGVNIGDIVIDIISGAQDGTEVDLDGDRSMDMVAEDATTVRNKIEVAQALAAERSGTAFDAAITRNLLADVGTNRDSVESALLGVDTLGQAAPALTADADPIWV